MKSTNTENQQTRCEKKCMKARSWHKKVNATFNLQELWCDFVLVKKIIIDIEKLNQNETQNLTHWGRVTHICVSKLTIIGLDNGLSPDRRQAIIWSMFEYC